MRVRYSLLLLLAAGWLAGCSVPNPPCDLNAVVYPAGQRLQGGSLRLGVIDASREFPFDLPQALRQTGAELAVLDDVRWGFIEPAAPEGEAHVYEWDSDLAALDTRVREYQHAGFEPVIVLRAWNSWARASAPQGGAAAAAASTPPLPEHTADYAAWVGAVVERYDADGVDDAPMFGNAGGNGVPNPVRYYQIEEEAANGVWWQGDSPETATSQYVTLLRAASAAARAAEPEVRILAASAPALDLLDGFPTGEGLQDVVSNVSPAVCGAVLATAGILAASDAYDILAVHSLADYTGLAVMSDWLATLGHGPVPVWITAATSAPALISDPPILRVNPRFPTTGEDLWSSLRHPADPQHENVERWYRAEQARLGFKKWVYAAVTGFDALVLGLEQDRLVLEQPELGLRDLVFQGLVDPADGSGLPAARPVVAALALAQSRLGGYSAVRRLTGLGDGIEAFAFTVQGAPVYVLWYENGSVQGPGDELPVTSVSLPVRASQLTMLTIPTGRGQNGPISAELTAGDGVVTLELSPTPVLVVGDSTLLFLPRLQK